MKFQYELATRKYQTLLKKELDKKEIQEGLIKACDVIDLIIEILRGSKNVKDARACLTDGVTDNITFKSAQSEKMASELRFTERQTTAILEMRLQKLIGLEIEALMKDHEDTLKHIAEYEDILENRAPNGANGIDPFKSYSDIFTGEAVASINPELIWGRNTTYLNETISKGSFSINPPGRSSVPLAGSLARRQTSSSFFSFRISATVAEDGLK